MKIPARVAFWVAAGAFTSALMQAGWGWLDALGMTALVFVLPALARVQALLVDRHLKEEGVDLEAALDRVAVYAGSMASLVVLAALALLLAGRGGGRVALELGPLPAGRLLAWAAALTLGVLGVVVVFRWAGARLGAEETELVRAILPRTRRERVWFVALSCCAGFAEEAAYRGYVLGGLTLLMGTGAAVLVSSVVFGFLHAYQGALGVARTAAMGLVLALGVILSGSLWPAVIAHALLDILLGLFLGERFMVPRAPPGV
ncbi:MAG: CPBP family intramembrane glutamic endopeptidase [Gemmatimonadota bacterium]